MSYIARSNYQDQKDIVGNGECVTLVNFLADTGASSLWREGAKIADLLKSGNIPEGTVIATFVKGRYQNLKHGNHAAIFVRWVAGGIEVFDQWHDHKPSKRLIRFGRPVAAGVAQRPELYSVVQ